MSLIGFPKGTVGKILEGLFPEVRAKMEFTSNKSYPISYSLYLNPNHVSFRGRDKFINEARTSEGKVLTIWTDDDYRADDWTEMAVQGRSGDVSRRKLEGLFAGNVAGISSKLLGIKTDAWSAFHRLQRITREPMFVVDDDNVLRFNEQRIIYHSPAFPDGIVLFGHYKAPMEFTEDANNPRVIEYTYTFIVQRSDPPLENIFSSGTFLGTAFGKIGSIVERVGNGGSDFLL